MRWFVLLGVLAVGCGEEAEPVCRPFAEWGGGADPEDTTVCACQRCGPTAAEEDVELIECDDGWTLGIGSVTEGLDPEDYDEVTPDLENAEIRVQAHCQDS